MGGTIPECLQRGRTHTKTRLDHQQASTKQPSSDSPSNLICSWLQVLPAGLTQTTGQLPTIAAITNSAAGVQPDRPRAGGSRPRHLRSTRIRHRPDHSQPRRRKQVTMYAPSPSDTLANVRLLDRTRTAPQQHNHDRRRNNMPQGALADAGVSRRSKQVADTKTH